MIKFDKDNYKHLLICIGDDKTISIRWFRDCPFGCTSFSYAWETDEPPCSVCNDFGEIPWYRGWIASFGLWVYDHIDTPITEWWMVDCPKCDEWDEDCQVCGGHMVVSRWRKWRG